MPSIIGRVAFSRFPIEPLIPTVGYWGRLTQGVDVATNDVLSAPCFCCRFFNRSAGTNKRGVGMGCTCHLRGCKRTEKRGGRSLDFLGAQLLGCIAPSTEILTTLYGTDRARGCHFNPKNGTDASPVVLPCASAPRPTVRFSRPHAPIQDARCSVSSPPTLGTSPRPRTSTPQRGVGRARQEV